MVILNADNESEVLEVGPTSDTTAVESYDPLIVSNLELLIVGSLSACGIIEIHFLTTLINQAQFPHTLIGRSPSLDLPDRLLTLLQLESLTVIPIAFSGLNSWGL